MKGDPILYAEDDENDVLFMQRAFRQAGVANPLAVVRDGQEAIDYLSGKEKYSDRKLYPLPCLVLLDLKLPRKYGLDVLSWIRHHPVYHTLVVIMLTASRQDLDAHVAYGMGANAYLVKPSSSEALVQMVQAMRDFWLRQNLAPPEPIKLAQHLVGENGRSSIPHPVLKSDPPDLK